VAEGRAEIGGITGLGTGSLGIYYREICLSSVATQFDEQVKGLGSERVLFGNLAVDFIDDHNRFVAHFEGFLENKTGSAAWGLRQHPPAEAHRPPIIMTRSTSPPKSAWPGVSTMFILTFHR